MFHMAREERDLLVPIRPEQEQVVREKSSVGSGATQFKSMRKVGGRAFILVLDGERSRVIGYLPIDEIADESDNPGGWRYRVKCSSGRAVWFESPAPFQANASNSQWPTYLSPDQSEELLMQSASVRRP